VDNAVDTQRHATQVYRKLYRKSRTVASLICMEYGCVQEEEAEELYAVLVKLEGAIRKRKAEEAAGGCSDAKKHATERG
jgi:muramidase (phage lysozyme)